MGKYTGIKYGTSNFLLWFHKNLKQELLFFNQIGIINLSASFKELAESIHHEYGKEYTQKILSDIELLEKDKLIFDDRIDANAILSPANDDALKLERMAKVLMQKKAALEEKRLHYKKTSNPREVLKCDTEIESLDHVITDYITRSRSIFYNSFNSI